MEVVPVLEKFEFIVDDFNKEPSKLMDMLIKLTFDIELESMGDKLNSPTPELKSHYRMIASGKAIKNGVSTVCKLKMLRDFPVPFTKEGIGGVIDIKNPKTLLVAVGKLKIPKKERDNDEYLKITIVPHSNEAVVKDTYESLSSKKTLELINAGRKRFNLPPFKPGDSR